MTDPPSGDGGLTLEDAGTGDTGTSTPNGDDDSGQVSGDDDTDSGSVTPGDDDSGQVSGDDDSGQVSGDDDSGSTSDDAGQPVIDAGHDAGQPVIDAGHDAGQPVIDAGQPTADAGCSSAAVVVNELQSAGAGGASDEWVELFNPSSCAVDISGWTLKYLAITGTSKITLWTASSGAKIAAGGYAVVAGTAYTGSAAAIGTFTNGLAAAGGGVGIFDATDTQLDSVGYGTGATNAFIETSAAAAPGTSQSIARTPNGHDTNDNATDFVVATTPTPGAKN